MPFAAALSTVPATARAVDDVCKQLNGKVAAPDLAVIFVSPHHADAATCVAKSLHERLKPKALVGCVGEAVVATGREVENSPAISLWLADWAGRVAVEAFHLAPRQTSDGLSLLG